MLWTEKYKPKSFEEYIGNKQIVEIAKKFTNNMPHLFLVGPDGVGKKTLAKLIAKNLLKEEINKNFIYIDLSKYPSNVWFKSKSEWSYNEQSIAEKYNIISVKDSAFSLPINAPFKMIILDQVQKLDFLSQQALRVIIEKSSSMTRFVLMGNGLGNIIQPILSRVSVLRFKGLSYEEFEKIMEKVLNGEKVEYDKKIIPLLYQKLNGNAFKAITILNSLKEFTLDEVKKALETKMNMSILFYHIEKKNIEKIRDSIKYLIYHLNYTPEGIMKGAIDYIKTSNIEPFKKIKLIKKIASLEPEVYNAYEPFIQLEKVFLSLIEE